MSEQINKNQKKFLTKCQEIECSGTSEGLYITSSGIYVKEARILNTCKSTNEIIHINMIKDKNHIFISINKKQWIKYTVPS